MSAPNIVIHVEGGLVQAVLSELPLQFTVIDYDTENLEEESLCKIPQGDGTFAQAYFRTAEANSNPGRVQEIIAACNSHPSTLTQSNGSA